MRLGGYFICDKYKCIAIRVMGGAIELTFGAGSGGLCSRRRRARPAAAAACRGAIENVAPLIISFFHQSRILFIAEI